MPRGPRGERRPADVIGAAIMVARLATGEVFETTGPKSGRSRSGIAGARDYDPDFVASILQADSQAPEAKFNNVVDMLDWLNRD